MIRNQEKIPLLREIGTKRFSMSKLNTAQRKLLLEWFGLTLEYMEKIEEAGKTQ